MILETGNVKIDQIDGAFGSRRYGLCAEQRERRSKGEYPQKFQELSAIEHDGCLLSTILAGNAELMPDYHVCNGTSDLYTHHSGENDDASTSKQDENIDKIVVNDNACDAYNYEKNENFHKKQNGKENKLAKSVYNVFDKVKKPHDLTP